MRRSKSRELLGIEAPMQIEDQILIDRMRAGDTSAFDRLLQKHRPMAYRCAYRFTRDRNQADDVVAETMVRMHRAILNLKEGSSLTAWMCRIIRNCSIALTAKVRRNEAVSLDAPHESEEGESATQFEDRSPSAFEVYAEKERLQSLKMAVRGLPCSQRELVDRQLSEPLSCQELSAVFGAPIGTIKSRLHRARHALIRAMESPPSTPFWELQRLSKSGSPRIRGL